MGKEGMHVNPRKWPIPAEKCTKRRGEKEEEERKRRRKYHYRGYTHDKSHQRSVLHLFFSFFFRQPQLAEAEAQKLSSQKFQFQLSDRLSRLQAQIYGGYVMNVKVLISVGLSDSPHRARLSHPADNSARPSRDQPPQASTASTKSQNITQCTFINVAARAIPELANDFPVSELESREHGLHGTVKKK